MRRLLHMLLLYGVYILYITPTVLALGEFCLNGVGEQGSCINVSTCQEFGINYPGHCPGPTDIQCCVNNTTPEECTIDSGKQGVCISTSSCLGSSVPGYCPGPIQIQCCVNETSNEECNVLGTDGYCKDVAFCDGASTPGFCPGAPTSIQCCTETSQPTIFFSFSQGETVPCQIQQYSGECKSVSTCDGINMPGYCPGPTDIQCCVPVTGPEFLPQSPTASGSSCTTPYNGYQGECIHVKDCTGATFNDLCSGGSQIKCCVAETDPVRQITAPFNLNQTTFQNLFTGISSTRAEALRPYFNYGLNVVTLTAETEQIACYRTAGFVAQLGYESGGLKYFEEIASGEAYNGRVSLGNTEPGDGPRFKGRGPIQLTGRANYRSAGNRLGLDLENNPESVCFPSLGFLTSVDYWISRDLNIYASSNDDDDFRELTRRINGGYNGLEGRFSRWEQAKNVLQCASASQELLTPFPTQSPATFVPSSQGGDNGLFVALVVTAGAFIIAGVAGIMGTLFVRRRRVISGNIKVDSPNPLYWRDNPY